MKQTGGAKIGLEVGIALVALGVIGGVSHRSTSKFIENTRQVEHTLQVIEQLESLLGKLNELETLQPGYLLTGAARYLESYDAILLEMNNDLSSLRPLIADNANQQRRLVTLEPVIKERLARLTGAVTVLESATSEILTNRHQHPSPAPSA
jgi:CHASE3 domain sensor protein